MLSEIINRHNNAIAISKEPPILPFPIEFDTSERKYKRSNKETCINHRNLNLKSKYCSSFILNFTAIEVSSYIFGILFLITQSQIGMIFLISLSSILLRYSFIRYFIIKISI